MGRKSYTRQDVQSILENTGLCAAVSYMDREASEAEGDPDNWIIYLRGPASAKLSADDGLHLRKASLQVVHYHKRKLDSIGRLMAERFGTEPKDFGAKQPDTDYWATYYEFEIVAEGGW
jgi:hypothetical protein